jgi:hypothetical protein
MNYLIPRSELSYRKMRSGNERKFSMVVDGDAVIEWTGHGWVLLRPAQAEDHAKLPAVAQPPPTPPLVRSDARQRKETG